MRIIEMFIKAISLLKVCLVIAVDNLALRMSTKSLEIVEAYYILRQFFGINCLHSSACIASFFLLHEPRTAQWGYALASKEVSELLYNLYFQFFLSLNETYG